MNARPRIRTADSFNSVPPQALFGKASGKFEKPIIRLGAPRLQPPTAPLAANSIPGAALVMHADWVVKSFDISR